MWITSDQGLTAVVAYYYSFSVVPCDRIATYDMPFAKLHTDCAHSSLSTTMYPLGKFHMTQTLTMAIFMATLNMTNMDLPSLECSGRVV